VATPAADEVGRLWRQYRATQDPKARERLILTYAPLVKFVAGRVKANLPAHVDEEELASDGILGLIEAVRRFDPEQGVRFETFALPRIRGAILDQLRERDWVPRSVRARAREIEATMGELARRLGRPASDHEVADALGIEIEDYRVALDEIHRSHIHAFDEVVGGDGENDTRLDLAADPNAEDPGDVAERADRLRALRDARAQLPDRDRLVLELYYDEGLRLREIGEVMNVTESRVSQIHTRATLRLRSLLAQRAA
jgi:RNA polymerase sigma factor for flagellar operon FliA